MAGDDFERRGEITGSAIRQNIEAVARLEEESARGRSLLDRLADWIADLTGSPWLVIGHALVYGSWIIVNARIIPGLRPFDPFPFLLLSTMVSLEAIFLSTFVLMKQNRMSRRADQRAHLDLQINLLAEKEMTLMLQMLHRISTRIGVRQQGKELEELAGETSVEALATEIKERLPKE